MIAQQSQIQSFYTIANHSQGVIEPQLEPIDDYTNKLISKQIPNQPSNLLHKTANSLQTLLLLDNLQLSHSLGYSVRINLLNGVIYKHLRQQSNTQLIAGQHQSFQELQERCNRLILTLNNQGSQTQQDESPVILSIRNQQSDGESLVGRQLVHEVSIHSTLQSLEVQIVLKASLSVIDNLSLDIPIGLRIQQLFGINGLGEDHKKRKESIYDYSRLMSLMGQSVCQCQINNLFIDYGKIKAVSESVWWGLVVLEELWDWLREKQSARDSGERANDCSNYGLNGDKLKGMWFRIAPEKTIYWIRIYPIPLQNTIKILVKANKKINGNDLSSNILQYFKSIIIK